MGEHQPGRAAAYPVEDDGSSLHVASRRDATEARHRTDRLAEILDRGDLRDRSAERRDRDAEDRDLTDPHGAALDREWSRRDRDRAAEDRADLVELLQSPELTTSEDAARP
jgi:hypothetical protein